MQHYMQVFVLPPWRLNSEEGASLSLETPAMDLQQYFDKGREEARCEAAISARSCISCRLWRTSISQHRFNVFIFHFPACQSLRRWDTTVWLPVTGWIKFQKVCSWPSDRQARASLKRRDTKLNEKNGRERNKVLRPTGASSARCGTPAGCRRLQRCLINSAPLVAPVFLAVRRCHVTCSTCKQDRPVFPVCRLARHPSSGSLAGRADEASPARVHGPRLTGWEAGEAGVQEG